MDRAHNVHCRRSHLVASIESHEVLVRSAYGVEHLRFQSSLIDLGGLQQRLSFDVRFLSALRTTVRICLLVAMSEGPSCCFVRPQRTVIFDGHAFVPNARQLEENISRLMFMCILRLSTHKESTVRSESLSSSLELFRSFI